VFDRCLYFNTTALARVVEREWTQAFKRFGLTPSQGFLLRLVLTTPGRSQHELATELTVSRPTATRLIDGLERLKLVERRAEGPDARHWSVFPTAKAVALHAALDAASATATQKLKHRVGEETFARTVQRIREVCAALK
jgi:DNA-binding MarR family transcriptional regulator